MRYALAIATLLAALLLASLAQASAQEFPLDESDTGKCICMRSSGNAACARKPNPEVLAALRKQFPQMTDNEDVIVFDDDHQCYNSRCYTVAFSTPLRNMACTLTLKGTELFGPLLLTEEILTEPLDYSEFSLAIPTGPGLGITLDEAKLNQFRRGRAEQLMRATSKIKLEA